jgi:hypothetical protein
MLPVAGRLACIVHGEGDARDVAHALDPLDRVELVAVIVNLAAMVDPDARLADLLGYVTWDENGNAAKAPQCGDLTLRSLVPADVVTPSGNRELLDHEQRSNAVALMRRGLCAKEISTRSGVHPRTVRRWMAEDDLARQQAHETNQATELRSA